MCTEERKPHKHAALIKAWADGAIIQFKGIYGVWADTDGNRPTWTADEYRIKPALVKSVGYRRYLWASPENRFFMDAVHEDTVVITPCWASRRPHFVRWIDTEWQYETVEVK